MNQKTLIILVVVLVLLFFVGMGAGFITKDGEGSNAQGTPAPFNLDVSWIEGIGNSFSPRIGSNDVNWGAPQACPTTVFSGTPVFVLTETASCRFTFRASDTRSRTLKLAVNAAGAPVVNLTYVPFVTGIPDKSDIAYGATLNANRNTISIGVRQHGGTLTIICSDGASGTNQCSFRLNP